jgi:hypothetical protein
MRLKRGANEGALNCHREERPLVADTVEKVENRMTPKISQMLLLVRRR